MFNKKLQKIKAIATPAVASADTIMEIFLLKKYGEKIGLKIMKKARIILVPAGEELPDHLAKMKTILPVGIEGDPRQKTAILKERNVAYVTACELDAINEPAVKVLLNDVMRKRKDDTRSIMALLVNLKNDYSQRREKIITETLEELEERHAMLSLMNAEFENNSETRKVGEGTVRTAIITPAAADKHSVHRQADSMAGIAMAANQTDVLIHRTMPYGNFISTSEKWKGNRELILKRIRSAESTRRKKVADTLSIWTLDEDGVIKTKLGYVSELKFDEITEIVDSCFNPMHAVTHSWVATDTEKEAMVA